MLQAEIEARAVALGAVVHPKPFSPQHLMQAIESALATPFSNEDATQETGVTHA